MENKLLLISFKIGLASIIGIIVSKTRTASLLHSERQHLPNDWRRLRKKCSPTNISTVVHHQGQPRAFIFQYGTEVSSLFFVNETEAIAFQVTSLLHGDREHLPKDWQRLRKKCLCTNISIVVHHQGQPRAFIFQYGTEVSSFFFMNETEAIAFQFTSPLHGKREHLPKDWRRLRKKCSPTNISTVVHHQPGSAASIYFSVWY